MSQPITCPPEMAAYPTVIELAVHWGEQDPNGHVNHAAPIRWLESARWAYIHQAELGPVLSAAGLTPVIASIRCDYRQALTYPEQALIGARVTEIGRSRMEMEQSVFGRQINAVAIKARCTVVFVDPQSGRPRRIPDEVRAILAPSPSTLADNV